MKKIIFFLLLSCFCLGQEISPYYPATQPEAYLGETTQLTYYDSQYVINNLISFLSYNMLMTQTDIKKGKTAFENTYVFQDKLSNGKLYITLQEAEINVKALYPVIVIKLKISGTKDRVFSFFINYWNTTINWDASKSDVERRHMQDIIRLHFNNGNPYITVANATYKNSKDFENFFNDLKLKEAR